MHNEITFSAGRFQGHSFQALVQLQPGSGRVFPDDFLTGAKCCITEVVQDFFDVSVFDTGSGGRGSGRF